MANIKQIYIDRLKEIINKSYQILIHKLGNGSLNAQNEASFQLEFAYILKTIGNLYEFNLDDKFHLELESYIKLTEKSPKSRSNQARVDLVAIYKNNDVSVRCAIELKFFKKENHREPNNRYDVFQDLKNLELYKKHEVDFCYFILGTNHAHYYNQERYSIGTGDFDFRHSKTYQKGKLLKYNTKKPHGGPISLENDYSFYWDSINNLHFLKVEV